MKALDAISGSFQREARGLFDLTSHFVVQTVVADFHTTQLSNRAFKDESGQDVQFLFKRAVRLNRGLALWPCKKLTGSKQTARFSGGSLLVSH